MTTGDDTPEDEQPPSPPPTPGDGRYDRFRRATDVPPEAADAMRDAVRRGLEEAGVQPGALPPELAAAMEAQQQRHAEAREMNLLSMGMQAAGLHECFISLVGAGFSESQALYYMAKVNAGI